MPIFIFSLSFKEQELIKEVSQLLEYSETINSGAKAFEEAIAIIQVWHEKVCAGLQGFTALTILQNHLGGY